MNGKREFLMGNSAIALGLLEAGCEVMASYPGTPSSEILPEFIRLSKLEGIYTYAEWSTNEKVAFDVAYAAAVAGKRAACAMKQVGLNVALDSLMSSAYIGAEAGFVVISCDDPGPHSSQTEQDTRLVARLAKVPVFDPSTPQEAREMVAKAMEVSEEFKIPVIVRPAIRVCHGRELIQWGKVIPVRRRAEFKRDPNRWAATPRFRYFLHKELNQKLLAIQRVFEEMGSFNRHTLLPQDRYPLGVIACGTPYAVVKDLLDEFDRTDIPLFKLGTPFPLPEEMVKEFMERCQKVLVLEETDMLVEYLIGDTSKVLGRRSGHVPLEGELVPEVILSIMDGVLLSSGLETLTAESKKKRISVEDLKLPVRRPRLCPGCPHRPVFYAIRRSTPKGIFTSDIGCYTLGLNLGAVDTCLDMGAAITMASGFYMAHRMDGDERPVIATIGDSTFYHSGTAGLLNAVYNNARFILIVLDNEITAMTGMQPTPGLGVRADGGRGNAISLERLISGCGVEFIRTVDSYDLAGLLESIKEAKEFTLREDGGVAVIIARHPCVIAYKDRAIPNRVVPRVGDGCNLCKLCFERFECPAISVDRALKRAFIDPVLCAGCGVCIKVCPEGAIKVI